MHIEGIGMIVVVCGEAVIQYSKSPFFIVMKSSFSLLLASSLLKITNYFFISLTNPCVMKKSKNKKGVDVVPLPLRLLDNLQTAFGP